MTLRKSSRAQSARRNSNAVGPHLRRTLRAESLESRDLLAVMLLKDVAPNSGNSGAADYVQLGNLTFFTANDNSHGVELWKTDGTTAGTSMVVDIAPGAPSSAPQELTVFNGKLYFTVNDQVHGRELWVSDGTSGGTQMVIDIDAVASSSPSELTVVGNELLFAAYDATHGTELWKLDTSNNASLVQDLRSGSFGSSPEELTAVGTTLFFSASNTDAVGRELWKYSAGSGVSLVRNIADLSFESANPQELTAVGNQLYFTAVGPSDNYFGRELYVSDGTSNGTFMVKDINSGVADSTPLHLSNINGQVWFSATTAAAGRELWKSDGTSNGTTIVNDYTPGSSGSDPVSIVYATAGVFVHYDTYNYIVYYPDSGPVEYRGNNIYPGSEFVAGPNALYFARSNSGFNYELWKINTTTRAVTLVQEIHPSDGSYPSSLAFLNGALYFTANDGTNGVEPWIFSNTLSASIANLPNANTSPERTALSVSASVGSAGWGSPYAYAWSVTKQGAGSPLATGTSSTFNFTPNTDGLYDLVLTVTDVGNQSVQVQQTLTITNVPPTVTIGGLPSGNTSPENTALNLMATIGNAGAGSPYTYAWTVTKQGAGSPFATGTNSTISFTPNVEGTYTVDLTLTDSTNESAQAQAILTITDVTPSVAIVGLPSGNTVQEGTAVNLSASMVTPGAGSPYTYAWTVTKQGSGSPFATGTSGTFSFTPNDNGAYLVNLTVTDAASAQAQAQATITATNVAPVATIQSPATTGNVGAQVSMNGQASDVGSADTLTYQWTVMRGSTQVAAGSGTSLAFTPILSGNYQVTFTANDDDGGSDSDEAWVSVSATHTQHIVARMYDDLLGRAPEAAGLQYWVAAVENGRPLGQVLRSMMNSAEYRTTVIQAAYQQYLGRAAENAAVTFWNAFFASGGTELDFRTSLLASAEYRGHYANNTLYVQSLYTNILGRTGDAGGVSHQVNRLASPTENAVSVVRSMLLSQESLRRQVDQAYQQFFHRTVDTPGATYWLPLLSAGTVDFNQMFELLVSSTEYGSA